MFCPECGFDAQEARFCPECGAGLDDLRANVSGAPGDFERDDAPQARRAPRPATRNTGARGRTQPASPSGRPRSQRRAAARAGTAPGTQTRQAKQSRLSPAVVWMGFAVLAVVVIGVVIVAGRTPSGASGSTGGAGQTTTPLSVDTSGSYTDLVARANGLYDQGAQASQNKDQSGAVRYFGAAAKVYRAAWGKQPGDPNVGTDYATTLFYSGDTAGALKQVDVVLAKSPDFQTAHLNKGVYLQTASQDAQQSGKPAKATSLLAQAKAEFQKAVAIDATSGPGVKAAASLKSL